MLPKQFSQRILVVGWLMFCLLIIATFSANLIAFLTVELYKVPFRTLLDVSHQQEYAFGTLYGTLWIDLFKVKLIRVTMTEIIKTCTKP